MKHREEVSVDSWSRQRFLTISPKVKTDLIGLHESKKFCSLKDTIKKIETSHSRGKIFVIHNLVKFLYPDYIKNSQNLRKQITQF